MKTFYKIIVSLITIIAIASVITKASVTANSTPTQLRLLVRLDKSSYRVGESIKAKVEIENDGYDAAILPAVIVPPHHWLRFIIKRDGKELNYSGPVVDMFRNVLEERIRLRPHYLYGKEFPLTDLYTIKQPGSYTIQGFYEVKTPVAKGEWVGKIHSKVVSFNVAK